MLSTRPPPGIKHLLPSKPPQKRSKVDLRYVLHYNPSYIGFYVNASHQQVEGGLVGVGASASAGVSPVPSGVTLYTASATATASKSSAATSSGSAAAAPSSTSTSKSSDGKKLIASSFVVLLGAAIGISLA